jgi:hypothetical protein
LATTLASASLLLIGLEGIVCIAMALPLTVCLGALGGVLFYSARPFGRPRYSCAVHDFLGYPCLRWHRKAASF